jgi:hypothetical protein
MRWGWRRISVGRGKMFEGGPMHNKAGGGGYQWEAGRWDYSFEGAAYQNFAKAVSTPWSRWSPSY